MAKKAKKGSLRVYTATYSRNNIKTTALVVAPRKKMAIKAINDETAPYDLIIKRVKVQPHFVQILKQEAEDKEG